VTGSAARWVVVIPFKGAPHGKSRLGAPAGTGLDGPEVRKREGFDVEQRAALAFAFLRDTIAAVDASGLVQRVLVVSAAPEVGALPAEFPVVRLVEDPGGGLNSAVRAGIEDARHRFTSARVAAMTGDLPVLQPPDLRDALLLAGSVPLGVCADRGGTGSTMITMAAGVEVVPQFGVDSFDRHVARGHAPIAVPSDSSLRFDIDTVADLDDARAAGLRLGESTASVLDSIGA
jgi:2-phospho-L-lactate/phosphoenolpyruvate guanylyltransferase